jgi:hypothetical protein
MIGRSHLRVLFPQFKSQLRVAFQADAPAFLRKVQQGKHLPGHFKYQCSIVEWESFGGAGFGKVVFADFFDIHNYLVCVHNLNHSVQY